MTLPYVSMIDLKECGCSFGTICAELLISERCTPHLINDGLVTLIDQMINGLDTREQIRQHLNGRFDRLIIAAECAAAKNGYIFKHLNAIKRPFNIN